MTEPNGTATAPSELEKDAPEKKERNIFTARTFLSAAIYGAIGAAFAYWVAWIGDRPDRKVGTRIWPWIGGLAGAFIAAFTASQESEKEHKKEAERRQAQLSASPEPSEPVALRNAAGQEPAMKIDHVTREGTIEASSRQLSA